MGAQTIVLLLFVVACVDLPNRRAKPRLLPHCTWDYNFPDLRVGLHFPAVAFLVAFSHFWPFWCGYYNLMPPTEHDLRLYTITQLIQWVLSAIFELAKRFRVAAPPVPQADEVPPFHCHEQCRHCTCTCIRTDPTHRRHLCRVHLGF